MTFSDFTTIVFILTSATVAGAACALAGTVTLEKLVPDIQRLSISVDAEPPFYGP